jgi:hypothetical protein
MSASKACDRTGIVAVACARHGCFAPNSIVDLFRGEQQKNVDWAFLEALRTTGVQSDQGVMIIYDIACQYFVHLHDRIGHLLPTGLEVDRAIGLFHVHCHKEDCFWRFASSFIPGAGMVAGEILESLWSGLNTITPATRTASLAHRAEIIDDHAADSNYKKALGIGEIKSLLDILKLTFVQAAVISDRFIQATEMSKETTVYYEKISSTVSAVLRRTWNEEIINAERHRLENPSLMDILGAQIDDDQRPDQRPDEYRVQATGSGNKWLQLALAIEEKQ